MNRFFVNCCRIAALAAAPVAWELPPVSPANFVTEQVPRRTAEQVPLTGQQQLAAPLAGSVELAQFTEDSEGPELKPTSSVPTAEELREIIQLRRRTSPLRGTLLDDRDFAEQLTRDLGQPLPQAANSPTSGRRGPDSFFTAPADERADGDGVAASKRPLNDGEARWRRHACKSLFKRLDLIADELEALGRAADAQRAREIGYRVISEIQ